jgi:ATP-dependent DNA ligase
LFDVLYADGFDVTGLALVARKRVLRDLFLIRRPAQFL